MAQGVKLAMKIGELQATAEAMARVAETEAEQQVAAGVVWASRFVAMTLMWDADREEVAAMAAQLGARYRTAEGEAQVRKMLQEAMAQRQVEHKADADVGEAQR